jgi:hypothetical protein
MPPVLATPIIWTKPITTKAIAKIQNKVLMIGGVISLRNVRISSIVKYLFPTKRNIVKIVNLWENNP